MSLARYHAKRKFSKTPEPRGIEQATSDHRFVVQKHDATNLHYDLRLEHKGVMLSWAVPKGPSLDPSVRHLAAQTEDHPLEYRHFEGVIPEGYGAGTVMVWDQGTFEWVERNSKHMSFILHGGKLHGEFALIKFPRAGEKSWILLKKYDKFAKKESIVRAKPNSVVTGRSLDEILRGKQIKGAFIKSIEGSRKLARPRHISAMNATLIAEPFNDPEWLFETKWDGFRGLAYIDGQKLRLVSRNDLDLLKRFPTLKNIGDAVAAKRAILDGEIVAINKKGVDSFEGLGDTTNNSGNILKYEAFDLLYLDGYDLTRVPLIQRKALLRTIIKPSTIVGYTDHIEAAGTTFFREVTKQGHEGMVAKDREAQYEEGKRTKTWLKIKKLQSQEFVIGGWQEGTGARSHVVGSLLLGVYEKNKLIPVGKVGSGFSDKDLESLTAKLKKLTMRRSPFVKKGERLGKIHYVKPLLVAQIKFAEWTSEGQLRQPVYLGLRVDKKPRDVVREEPHQTSVPRSVKTELPGKAIARPELNASLALGSLKETSVTIEGNSIDLSNLSKPFWSRPKIVKRDIIEYYNKIAPVLLPHLMDRPLTLKRYPNGAKGGFFYQKNAPTPHPRFVKTVTVKHRQGPTRYVLCNDVETLIWLANLADLEMHPWYSRVGSLNHPDFVVFDLDPTKPNDLASVRAVALLIKEVLDQHKLVSFAKSSGSRGIHIYVPIKNNVSYDHTKRFAKKVTEIVHHIAPKQTTLEFRKARRVGIYIDYLQNIKGKTLASVYSLRARPGAPASIPLTWSEVKKGFRITDFTIHNAAERVLDRGDLFAETLTLKQDLRPALSTLEETPTRSQRRR